MNMLQLHAQQVEAAANAKTPHQRRKAQAAAAQAFVSRMTWPSEASGGKEAAAKKKGGKPKARRVCPQPTEHAEQVAFVKWFRLQYPGVLIFAIPNGGDRHAAVAAKLSAEGVTRGVPDLFIPAWQLFVEMKRKAHGRVSTEQAEMMKTLCAAGYTCLVAHGCEDAMLQVKNLHPVMEKRK